MTTIKVKKVLGNYLEISFEGHVSKKHGKHGKNIVCAAISMLSQTALKYLESIGSIDEYTVSDGYLKFTTKKRFINCIRINAIFDYMITGLKDLAEQYPDEVKLVY